MISLTCLLSKIRKSTFSRTFLFTSIIIITKMLTETFINDFQNGGWIISEKFPIPFLTHNFLSLDGNGQTKILYSMKTFWCFSNPNGLLFTLNWNAQNFAWQTIRVSLITFELAKKISPSFRNECLLFKGSSQPEMEASDIWTLISHFINHLQGENIPKMYSDSGSK